MSVRVEAAPEILDAYLADESNFRGHAEGVVRAGDLETIAATLRAASAGGVPLTISARRTSLTGAAVPQGGWVLALPGDSSPDLVRVDRAAAEATAPARVLVADLEQAAEAAGLFFPPDPTSRKTCSIGGAVACNASGARSFAHGPTGDWVVGLTVCLAWGEVLHLRRGDTPPVDGAFVVPGPDGPVRVPCPPARPTAVKNAVGFAVDAAAPDLIDLFIGSEGTLGYIHEVTVRLLPRQPVFAALVFWDDLGRALDFVQALQTAPPDGLEPMSVEWFDARSLALAAARHPRLEVPPSAVAGLFVEQRHAPGAEDDVAIAWYEALLTAGAPDDDRALRIARTARDLDAFREFRHAVPESINALARGRGLRKLGTDLAYPAGWLHRMVAYYTTALADVPAAIGPEACAAHLARWGTPPPRTLDNATFGHIGDNHLHVNLLPKDAAEAAAGGALYRALALHCAAHGGSISAEHGVGKTKRSLLAEVSPPELLARMWAVKEALDPAGILAPGNVLNRR